MRQSHHDISYLLEAEVALGNAPGGRVGRAVATPPAVAPDIVEIQAAIAHELIALDAAHEAFIQQFLQFGGRLS